MNWLQKYGGLLIAIGIAAYAIHGLMGADLVMPYSLGGLVRWTRFIHLRGMWAIGGCICLLLGAAGFALMSYGNLSAKPGIKPGREPHMKLATGLILVGAVFFLGVSALGKLFAHSSENGGMIEDNALHQFLDSHRPK
jgi:hypothetical protein